MNAIRDWLYIGKYRETLDRDLLLSSPIGAMLQLAELVRQSEMEELYLPVEDGVPLEAKYLQHGVSFVLRQRQLGRKVLVACGAGMSRSAALCVAVLKESEGLDLLEALKVVKAHHPDTLIHPALWAALCAYYAERASLAEAVAIMASSDLAG